MNQQQQQASLPQQPSSALNTALTSSRASSNSGVKKESSFHSSATRNASPPTSSTRKGLRKIDDAASSNSRGSLEVFRKSNDGSVGQVNENKSISTMIKLGPDQVLLTIEVIGLGNLNIVAEKDTDLIDVFDTVRSKIGMSEFGMQFFGLLEQIYDSEGSMPLGTF